MTERIGFGYDIHKLEKKRKLFLGGIEIPYRFGLKGHSDADVVLHALCDAILGALSLGDIGEYFPDNVQQTKNKRSTYFLQKIKEMADFSIINVDTTIIAEKPVLHKYKNKIRNNIAKLLEVKKDNISVKAKTNEGLGPIGEGKAIACYAVVLVKI
ncbi:MAG: 2-C-methyl-D-erythritol 2,4-cyclodiphosphate synthase [Candidatus Cloacimonas sp. 4484_209]|nr:MAG: 2-C-methyl-D-erythritol 2,4-cyclodiphosphate synthase [Candidatus Cloacimonas sp. 4484_209]